MIRCGKEDGNSAVEYRVVNSTRQAQGGRLKSVTDCDGPFRYSEEISSRTRY